MSDSKISLHCPPVANEEDQSLQFLISRIGERKGGFRSVTEQILEDEIQDKAEDTAITDAEEEDQEFEYDSKLEDKKTKGEQVRNAKGDMLTQVNQAQYEISMALDCISLLLSQRAPNVAATSMTAFTKENVPLGSLGGEVLQQHEKSEIERQQDELVPVGWRMKSLHSAADSLLNSSFRLEREVEKETVYWDEVLKVKEIGWPISRMPREKHALAVRYGFAEAHASFRDRGSAALRSNADGKISLDPGHRANGKRLTLRRYVQGKAIAVVSGRSLDGTQETGLNGDILDARNSIYDEEAIHELNREAHFLRNQDIKCINNSIIIPIDSNEHLEIALERPEDSTNINKQNLDSLLETAHLAVRLLLSQAHLRNLHDRERPPPPLQDGQRPRTVYPILKPLVEIFQHRSRRNSMQQLLANYTACLKRAGLSLSSQLVPTFNMGQLSNAISNGTESRRIQAASTLIDLLTSSTIKIQILDHPGPLTILVKTTMAVGTIYTIDRDSGADSKPVILDSLQEFDLELTAILKAAILSYIPKILPGWEDAEVGLEVITRYDEQNQKRTSFEIALSKECLRVVSLRSQMFFFWLSDLEIPCETMTMENRLRHYLRL